MRFVVLMKLTVALAALILLTSGTASAATQTQAAAESAWLTTTFSITITCYPTTRAFTASHPTAGYEIAGYVTFAPTVINLDPTVCRSLQTAREGFYGNQESAAIFDLSHELAHATGADLAYESAYGTDSIFKAQVAAIRNKYPTVDASREAAADCVGLSKSSAVAYRLGMRGHQAFAELAKYAGTQGYVAIPDDCRAS